jgi:hypothetical protein
MNSACLCLADSLLEPSVYPAINRGIYEARANNQKFFKEATEKVCYYSPTIDNLGFDPPVQRLNERDRDDA